MKYLKMNPLLALLWLLAGPAARAQAPAPRPTFQEALSIGPAVGQAASIKYTITDSVGNVYVSGIFKGTVRFGLTTLTARSGWQDYLAKWNKTTHRYQWAMALAVNGSTYQLAAGPGAVYLLRNDWQPANGVVKAGSCDLAISKVVDQGTTGKVAWTQRVAVATTGEDELVGSNCTLEQPTLAVQGQSVYLAGLFRGTLALGSLQVSNSQPHNIFSGDLFVAKLTEVAGQGRFVWARQSKGLPLSPFPMQLAIAGKRVSVAALYHGKLGWGTKHLPESGKWNSICLMQLVDAGATASFGPVVEIKTSETDSFHTELTTLAAVGDSLYMAIKLGPIRWCYHNDDPTQLVRRANPIPLSITSTVIVKLREANDSLQTEWQQQITRPEDVHISSLVVRGPCVYVAGWLEQDTARAGEYKDAVRCPQDVEAERLRLFESQPMRANDLFLAQLTDTGPGSRFTWVERLRGAGEAAWCKLVPANAGRVYLVTRAGPSTRLGAHALLAPGAPQTNYLLAFRLPLAAPSR